MTTWSTMLVPLFAWPSASQSRAVENARASATELCRHRVEREEVEAYLRARAADVRREEIRIARSG